LLLGLGGGQLGVGLLRRPRTWLGSGSPLLELAISSGGIDTCIAAAKLFLDSRARERYNRLG